MNDEPRRDELVSGFWARCRQEIPLPGIEVLGEWACVSMVPWRTVWDSGARYSDRDWVWADIGGGGPVMPAEAGTKPSKFETAIIEFALRELRLGHIKWQADAASS